MHVDGAAQVALVLRGLLREDVALERLTALDGATRTDAEPLGRALLGLHLGHWNAPLMHPWSRRTSRSALLVGLPGLMGEPAQKSASEDALSTGALRGSLGLGSHQTGEPGIIAQLFFLGASTMIIWRPSSLGMCSTTETSASSSRMRSSRRMPMSWWVISRPRKRSVTLPLSPSSAMKRRRLRILML